MAWMLTNSPVIISNVADLDLQILFLPNLVAKYVFETEFWEMKPDVQSKTLKCCYKRFF